MNLQNHLFNAAKRVYSILTDDMLQASVINKLFNPSGDTIKSLDIIANDIFIDELRKSNNVYGFASEENKNIISLNKKGNYSVTIDPLDGSQNIDVNLSIGSIFSIYNSKIGELMDFQQTGEKIIAAGYILYSQSLMFVWATNDGVDIFVYNNKLDRFMPLFEKYTIPVNGNIYSINEAKIQRWRPNTELQDLINEFKRLQYTMRFMGCMVADVHRILMKGGIFCYPADNNKPEGLLRLLYEAIPMAYVIKNAGGLATDGFNDLLTIKPTQLHSRIPVFMGSPHEMQRLNFYFNGLYKEINS
jgi:fructose-1,6-bisphosphatase I